MMEDLGITYFVGSMLVLWGHFIGDFVLQDSYRALDKGNDTWLLTKHVLVYMFPFLVFDMVLPHHIFPITALWLILNFVMHFVTDFVSSRLNLELWKNKNKQLFFVCSGADQCAHLTTLLVSYWFLVL